MQTLAKESSIKLMGYGLPEGVGGRELVTVTLERVL